MSYRFNKTLFALALLALSCQSLAATLTSSVNRNQIDINETVTLTVSIDDKINTDQLDLSQLKQDFEILGITPSSNSNISIINGQTTRQLLTRWTITMAAKRVGKLNVPALTVGGGRSNEIEIEVAAGGTNFAKQEALQAAIKTDKVIVYPRQQLLVEVELIAGDAVSDIRGDQLSVKNAEIQLLDQQNFQRIDNGIVQQVVVWKYAVFAEDAGELVIPVQTFTGVRGSNNDFFSTLRSRGQRVVARSNAVSITVEEAPEAQGRPWLPASNVTINAGWSGDTAQIRVGEPITRSIEIVASGQKGEAIPPLATLASAATYKSYRDQPQVANKLSTDGLTGIRTESEAIVPSISGELTLGEQSINWWDTQAKQWVLAVLPAETLTVLPASSTTIGANSETALESPASQLSAAGASNQQIDHKPAQNWIWKMAPLGLALICLFQFYLLSQRNATNDTNSASTEVGDDNDAWRQLQASFKSGDVRRIRKDLLRWSQLVIPGQEIINLQSFERNVKSRVPEPLAANLSTLLSRLDEQLYRENMKINMKEFINDLYIVIKELKDVIKQNNKNKKRPQEGLDPLYPS